MKIKHFLEGANGDDGGGGWAGRRTKNRLKRSEMDEWNVKWRPVTRIVPSYKKDKKSIGSGIVEPAVKYSIWKKGMAQ